jgi:hypothetical protein
MQILNIFNQLIQACCNRKSRMKRILTEKQIKNRNFSSCFLRRRNQSKIMRCCSKWNWKSKCCPLCTTFNYQI